LCITVHVFVKTLKLYTSFVYNCWRICYNWKSVALIPRHARTHTHTHTHKQTHKITNIYSILSYCMEQVLIEKQSSSLLAKNFPVLYGIRRFIASFTSARHLSLSWDGSIQSMPPHPASWRSIWILSSYQRLGLPSGLLSSGFSRYKYNHKNIDSNIRTHSNKASLYVEMLRVNSFT
jgi:hypothetical protein